MTGKRVPPGQPLLTETSDLDALAEISAQDVAEAQAAWRADADREHADLLDATDAGE